MANFRQPKPDQVWLTTPSGILYPGGMVTETSIRGKTTLLSVKADAEAIEALYIAEDVPLAPTSGLAQFIARAKAVADAWAANPDGKTRLSEVFAAMHMFRIAIAVLPLRHDSNRAKYLKRLASGEIDFFK